MAANTCTKPENSVPVEIQTYLRCFPWVRQLGCAMGISNVFTYAVIVGALFLTMVACSSSDGRLVLKVSHNGSIQHPYQTGFETFKTILEKETNDAVEVQIFENGQLGGEEEEALMVKMGALAASAVSSGGGLAPFVPQVELFNLPFIFRNTEHFFRVLDGPVGVRVARAVEKELDVIVLGWWFSGVRNIWNSKRPVLVPDDLQGLKIRVMATGVLVETFDSLGAQATPMSFGELYSALEQGVVDGAETDHVDLLYERFYEVTRYVSYTEHLYLASALIFSRKRFNRLSLEVQEAIRRAGQASVSVQRLAMKDKTKEALVELQEMGLQFFNVDRRLFQEKVRGVYRSNATKVGSMAAIQEVLRQ